MQTNREDVGQRYLELEVPVAPDRETAARVSEPFRRHFTALAAEREHLREDLRTTDRHHFFVSGAEQTPRAALDSGEVTRLRFVSTLPTRVLTATAGRFDPLDPGRGDEFATAGAPGAARTVPIPAPPGSQHHQEGTALATATASATKLRPLGDRVVVRPTAREEMTKTGIVLPDTAKEKPQEGTILAAGPGRILDDGTREAMDVKKGNKVLYAKYAGTEFKVDGEDLLIVSQKDILAIVED
jgi:chaperonin GroES